MCVCLAGGILLQAGKGKFHFIFSSLLNKFEKIFLKSVYSSNLSASSGRHNPNYRNYTYSIWLVHTLHLVSINKQKLGPDKSMIDIELRAMLDPMCSAMNTGKVGTCEVAESSTIILHVLAIITSSRHGQLVSTVIGLLSKTNKTKHKKTFPNQNQLRKSTRY